MIKQKFDRKTKKYSLEFFADPNAGLTSIFLDTDLHYESGFEVECHPDCKLTHVSGGKYHVLDSARFSKGQRVMIVIDAMGS